MTDQSPIEYRDDEEVDVWSIGLLMFAAIVMILAGAFQVFMGLVAILDDQFMVPAREHSFQFDRGAWGWVHLLLGLVVAAAGVALLRGRTWGRVAAIVLAACSAVAMFAFLPHYPLWALTVIALDVAVIWAVATHGGLGAPGR
jgi:hypothetical protein